jgi:hypothetical protein
MGLESPRTDWGWNPPATMKLKIHHIYNISASLPDLCVSAVKKFHFIMGGRMQPLLVYSLLGMESASDRMPI